MLNTPIRLAFLMWIMLYGNLSAQFSALSADFESYPTGTITSANQLNGFTILASQAASATPDPNDSHCVLPTCCWSMAPTSSELINAPNGYTDPTLGSYYTIYSVFGSSPAPASASLANPQINFPMGGSKFFRLGQALGSGMNRLSVTITVSDSTSFIDLAYASVINRAHTCCQDPGFRIEIDQATPCGTVLTNDCSNVQSVAGYFDVSTGNPAGIIFPHIFNKWRVKRFDLTPFMGSTVTLQITVYSCVFGLGPHQGYAYLDARCGSSAILFNGQRQLTYQTKKTLISCEPVYTLSAPPFYSSYTWNGPGGFSSTQQSFTNTASGSYTVVMTQDNNCATVTRTVEVQVVPPIQVVQSNTLCPGTTVTLSVGGALTYTWLNTSAQSNSVVVSPSVSTNYTVLGTDTNGCVLKKEFLLLMNNPPQLNLVYPPSMCLGQSATFTANGASGYEWYTSLPAIGSTGSQLTVTATQTGFQTFTVIGSLNTCTSSTSGGVVVHALPVASIGITPSATVCAGNAVVLNAFGGSYYHWTNSSLQTFSTASISYTPIRPETFQLYVVDINGCSSTTTQLIDVFPKPTGKAEGETKFCAPHQAWLVWRSQQPLSRLEWILAPQRFQGNVFHHLFQNAGSYPVQIVQTDSLHGCIDTALVQLTVYPKPIAEFTYQPERILERDLVNFVNLTQGELIQCNWYFADSDQTISCEKNVSFSFENEGQYPIVLTVQDANTCRDTVIKELQVMQEFAVFIPDAFTPNNDGLNDVFLPITRGIKFYHLEIFDRWGEKIFSSSNVLNGWDGNFKGRLCPSGIYTWLIQFSNTMGENKKLTGHVALLGEN